MAKPKINVKDLLIRRGEHIVLGLAGVCLVVLLIWGVKTGLGATNPDAIVTEMDTKAKAIHNGIATGTR